MCFSLQIAILPENGEDVISRAADVLGYPLDTVIQLAIPEGSQSCLAPPFTSEHPASRLGKDRHALLS